MEMWGQWVELIGTGITLLGLLYAWWRAWSRFDRFRNFVKDWLDRLVKKEPTTRIVQGFDRVTIRESATVLVKSDERAETVEGMLEIIGEREAALRQELDAVRESIRAEVEAAGHEVEASARGLVDEFKGELDTNAWKDLSVALFGVAMTAVGILLQICA
ncbi:hypothetical protein [Rhodococcus daqingensis]|uniref:DUF1640 domain-containing protein n=1 Tax=Rhodococcus daqingensis TaxID=2479363 RepID=A0ABW2RV30_9NOCA